MKPMMYYRFEIVSVIRQYPLLFSSLLKLNYKIRGRRLPAHITRDTELVLEGYFRTGNTFAALAFFLSQPRPTPIANHTHAIATLVMAARRSLPTLVLIRKPADTVVSAVQKAPGTTLTQHLKWYTRYYESVERLLDHFYVALFDELIMDFGQVIEKLNRRFGTDFAPFDHTEENVQKVFDWIEDIDRRIYSDNILQYSVPKQEKRHLKETMMRELEKAENRAMLERAERLYQRIAAQRIERSK